MLEFVSKDTVFEHLAAVGHGGGEIGLMDIQQAGVAAAARGFEMSRVGLVAGPATQLYRHLPEDNEFFLIDVTEAGHRLSSLDLDDGVGKGAPTSEVSVNVLLSCGQFDGVSNQELSNRLDALLEAVAPHGVMIHAMQFYLEDVPSGYWLERTAVLRSYADDTRCAFLSPVKSAPPVFSTRMATLSDGAMFRLFRSSEVMKQLRLSAQGAVLVFAYRRLR